MSLSTHVLDTATGEPAAGVPVTLLRSGPDGWEPVTQALTDADGRIKGWSPGPGRHALRFDVAAYLGPEAFFPEATVVFAVTDPARHLHVPLLLSPFGYTTYRGS